MVAPSVALSVLARAAARLLAGAGKALQGGAIRTPRLA
jgi:hypothetical protein